MEGSSTYWTQGRTDPIAIALPARRQLSLGSEKYRCWNFLLNKIHHYQETPQPRQSEMQAKLARWRVKECQFGLSMQAGDALSTAPTVTGGRAQQLCQHNEGRADLGHKPLQRDGSMARFCLEATNCCELYIWI